MKKGYNLSNIQAQKQTALSFVLSTKKESRKCFTEKIKIKNIQLQFLCLTFLIQTIQTAIRCHQNVFKIKKQSYHTRSNIKIQVNLQNRQVLIYTFLFVSTGTLSNRKLIFFHIQCSREIYKQIVILFYFSN